MIIEIKSSVADFRADRKWALYREFADRLYFAVPNEFPTLLIPEECGLIVADAFGPAGLRHRVAAPPAPPPPRAPPFRLATAPAPPPPRPPPPPARFLPGPPAKCRPRRRST